MLCPLEPTVVEMKSFMAKNQEGVITLGGKLSLVQSNWLLLLDIPLLRVACSN